MNFIDITRSLSPDLAVWPGDSPFSLSQICDRSQGDLVNLTSLAFGAHTGTHVDAPHHFADEAITIEALDLQPFWGEAQVVTIDKGDGPLFPDDFAHVDLRLATRLLIHSPASHRDHTRFWKDFVYPSPELADFLGAQGIILYGTDCPSVDSPDAKILLGHNALLKNKIAILENLDLSNAPDGLYDLSALPLKIVGGDGSPVRAVLKIAGE